MTKLPPTSFGLSDLKTPRPTAPQRPESSLVAPYEAWSTSVGWGKMPSREQIRTFRALIAKAPSDSLQDELDKGVYKGWKRFVVRRELERRRGLRS